MEGHYIWWRMKKVSGVASLEEHESHSRDELHNPINGRDLRLRSIVQTDVGLETVGPAKPTIKSASIYCQTHVRGNLLCRISPNK